MNNWLLKSGGKTARRLRYLAFLALPACFQLREPEPAVTASEWIQPTAVDILLANFTTAVQHLNVANLRAQLQRPRLSPCTLPYQRRFFPRPVY